MDGLEITDVETGTVEILDGPTTIAVSVVEVRETITIFDALIAVAVAAATLETVVLTDPDPITVELDGGPASSIVFQDGPIALVEILQIAVGLRGPQGLPGADGTFMQPTYRLRPAGGWNEAGDTYEDALPTEPLEPTEVVLIHGGVGARFHVDPPDADPLGTDFQLSGPQNRTIRFGDIRPREGDQIHVEPYLRA